MDRTTSYRRVLLARLLKATTLALPLAAIASGACGQGTIVGGSGASGSAGTGPEMKNECFNWPATGGSSASGDAGKGGAPPCPSKAEAQSEFPLGCGEATSDPSYVDGQCCYEVTVPSCLTGRPFVEEGVARTAPVRRGGRDDEGWRGPDAPSVAELDANTRAALAKAWTDDALLEHASVASFGRFALELLAVGAPAELVSLAHAAAFDEVEHARMGFGLASAYAGELLAPSRFAFGGSVEVSDDLASIAARAVREGCIGETLGAMQAAEQLAVATDPAVRRALTTIAEDEARHAELAWRFVAWALAAGGAAVRAAVRVAFETPIALPGADPSWTTSMLAHGRVDGDSLARLFARALDDVVRPCAARLLSN